MTTVVTGRVTTVVVAGGAVAVGGAVVAGVVVADVPPAVRVSAGSVRVTVPTVRVLVTWPAPPPQPASAATRAAMPDATSHRTPSRLQDGPAAQSSRSDDPLFIRLA